MKVNNYEYISEQDFDAVWGAHAKSNGDLYHHSEIRSLPLEHVRTVSEGDDVDEDVNLDNNWYASPGAHVVNALGYWVTVKAGGDGTPDAIWCLGEEEHAPDISISVQAENDGDHRELGGRCTRCLAPARRVAFRPEAEPTR